MKYSVKEFLPMIVLALALLNLIPSNSYAGAASSPVKKSIRGWVTCNGTTDDDEGVARAFAAARNAAFTLLVDCPVRIHIGKDITRPIFIDNGTTVQFEGTGKFIVDNIFIPAFVIANSSKIVLEGWNVEWNASLPVNVNNSGYFNDGKSEKGLAGNAFSDLTLTDWLAEHRGITFVPHQGVMSQWPGSTNVCAVFYMTGDTSSVSITGMNIYVPPTVGADQLIPVVFSMNLNYKSNQVLRRDLPLTSEYFALPHNLTFSNITLDGTYMGWVGVAYDVTVTNVQSYRYGDLEDAKGDNVGGVGKWFAPPHLFYWCFSSASGALLTNNHITIANVTDHGIRLGTARDKGGRDTISGYALSLKLVCTTCSVNNYVSDRPDGFMDVAASSNVTISNAAATYDSAFLNNIYPGWRFPSSTYTNIKFENVSLTDVARTTTNMPIGNATQDNNGIVFSNVRVGMNKWSGEGIPLPRIYGKGIDATLNYSIGTATSHIVRRMTQSASTTLQATPGVVKAGAEVELTWSTEESTRCDAGGSYHSDLWTGSIGTYGKRIIKMPDAGSYELTLECWNRSGSSLATVPIVVSK